MSKECVSLLTSVVLCIITGSLVGCGNASNDNAAQQSPIVLRISQGSHTHAVHEDADFHSLLKTPDAVDEDDLPASKMWHPVEYNYQKRVAVSVDNCAHVDLLDLVIYEHLDVQGRPDVYTYVPLCSVEVGNSCEGTQTIPSYAQHKFSPLDVEYFAFSGICISDDGTNAVSFISFLKKTNI